MASKTTSSRLVLDEDHNENSNISCSNMLESKSSSVKQSRETILSVWDVPERRVSGWVNEPWSLEYQKWSFECIRWDELGKAIALRHEWFSRAISAISNECRDVEKVNCFWIEL